jgi:predicted GNAT superfamily acetyltransferase
MKGIEIRPLQSMAEMHMVEEIERATWSMTDLEITSAHLLHALQHNGAPLLGAFDGPKMIGFTLGVLATVEGLTERIDQVAAARLKLYSVVSGVLPEYQHMGVGYALKRAQREFALRIGVRLITWTYDPLESLNGRFNIGKLGAVCHTYLRNFHGEMTGINAGLETDRFEVEWWVTSNRVQRRMGQKQRGALSLDAMLAAGALLVNEATFDSQGLPTPPPNYVSHPSNLILVEIPAHFQALKRQNFALALRWRAHTRDLFEKLFESDFVVTDFVYHTADPQRPRSFYLLTHRDA